MNPANISFFELKGKPVGGRSKRVVATNTWAVKYCRQTLGYYYPTNNSIALIVGMLEEDERAAIAECACRHFGVEGIKTPRNAPVKPMASEYEAPEDFGDF